MKKIISFLALSLCGLMAMNAQGGFQQNGSSLYYNNGNVGIGEMNPSQKLMVRGRIAIAPSGIVSDEGYNGHLMITKPAASGQYINLARSSNFVWSIGMVYNSNTFAIGNSYTDDSEFTNPYFSIGTNGYVGIRKANPEYQLDVNGTVCASKIKLDGRIGKDSYPFTYDNVSLDHFSMEWVNDPSVHPDNGYALWLSSYGGMKFFTTGQPRLTITTPGNVGIGTTTPSHTLEVNGTIRAKEVKVESDWADFVFDESYVLPTIEEVAKHIKERKHLPGIPSAEEIRKNGVSLGEINTKLLQKIEEQALYIIDLQRQIQEIKEQLKELDK